MFKHQFSNAPSVPPTGMGQQQTPASDAAPRDAGMVALPGSTVINQPVCRKTQMLAYNQKLHF